MPVVFGITIEVPGLNNDPPIEEVSYIWNVEQRIGPGSSGDDVRLVQYLLAMWGTDYAISGVLSVSDVDGSWGAQTSASMALFEKNHASAALADGVVDPMPPETIMFSAAHNSYLYKIYSLQWAYSQKRGRHDPMEVESEVVMDIPNDVTCPNDLSYALTAAQTKAGYNQ